MMIVATKRSYIETHGDVVDVTFIYYHRVFVNMAHIDNDYDNFVLTHRLFT